MLPEKTCGHLILLLFLNPSLEINTCYEEVVEFDSNNVVVCDINWFLLIAKSVCTITWHKSFIFLRWSLIPRRFHSEGQPALKNDSIIWVSQLTKQVYPVTIRVDRFQIYLGNYSLRKVTIQAGTFETTMPQYLGNYSRERSQFR